MSNTDQINAYFDNELNTSEKKMFEERLTNDSELAREFNFQHEIIDGIKTARSLQLKAMLNNVPVSGGNAPSLGTGKILGIIGLAAVIGWGIYYFYPDTATNTLQPTTENQLSNNENTNTEEKEDVDNIISDLNEQAEEENRTENTKPETEDQQELPPVLENKEDDIQQNEATKLHEQDAIKGHEEVKNPPVAPAFDTPVATDDGVKLPDNILPGKAIVASNSLEVDVDKSNKKYNFHYKFEGARLTLYGNFDKGLYEILEFNNRDVKNWFLSYENNFYSISAKEDKIQPLNKVTDPDVLTILNDAAKE